ncbi:daptide-type RiPP [Corynebacterium caspium]|uniref:daptide-type RiPP n=1 Tax=Corynebacterium caspium TaxID=234828 RepID=UPI00037330EE|nr:daptide-type RiPP [Corynebacterium caspium]WKD58607.1 hypothetical protein CCASP_00900 [Corynebacterium caspium DSM 44850]
MKNQLELLELDMQELEPMDAPGWWTGFQKGVEITVATLVFSVATAASAAT